MVVVPLDMVKAPSEPVPPKSHISVDKKILLFLSPSWLSDIMVLSALIGIIFCVRLAISTLGLTA